VHDPGGVSSGERIGDLCEEASDLGHRQWSAGKASGQRFALVMRHRDERLAGEVADLVDRSDVRVIERAGRARLSQQAGSGVGMAGGLRREELERDPAVEVRIFGQINSTHAARADVAEDPVVRDGSADHARLASPTAAEMPGGHVAAAHYAHAEWRIDR
jgi:hypothetical protein